MCNVAKCKTMDELFTCWKGAHNENMTKLPNGIGNMSFAPDGIICNEKYFGTNTRVLFIAKECNLSSLAYMNPICADGKSFWLQSVLDDPTIPRSRAGSRFVNSLSTLYNALKAYRQGQHADVCTDNEPLKEIAYINLNKRGGKSTSKYYILESYVKYYQEYLRKQIQLIDASLIVCCGNDVKRLVDNYHLCDGMRIVTVSHPSDNFVSYDANIKNLEEELAKLLY